MVGDHGGERQAADPERAADTDGAKRQNDLCRSADAAGRGQPPGAISSTVTPSRIL
jgi:hypothetical protein